MNQTKLPDHPAAEAEYLHLQDTCTTIDREIAEVEALTGAKAGECMDVQMKEDPDQQEEVTMQLFLAQETGVFRTAGFHRDRQDAGNLLPRPLGCTGSANAGSCGDRLAFTGG